MQCLHRKARKTVQVLPHETSQTWEGWGTSLAWFGNALGGDPAARDTVARLLFSPTEGLGLNIVRYNIGGANQQHVQEYRPGAAVPCLLQPDGSYDWDADAGQVSLLLAAAALGADTFEAFVNSPPWFWTVSGSSRGHQYPLKSNLDKQHIQAFAKFCADVVAHFQQVHGITFQSLSPFNEPGSPAWCLAANCKQEACYFSRRRAHKVLQALQEQPGLQQTLLVAHEQFCIRDTLGDLHHLPKQLRSVVGRVNTHTYDSSTFFHTAAKPIVLLQDNSLARRRLRRLLHSWGDVPLWVSEFGTGRGAFKLAKHIVKDLATLLPCAWVYWQAVEDLGAGWGLLEMPIRHPQPVSPCGHNTVQELNQQQRPEQQQQQQQEPEQQQDQSQQQDLLPGQAVVHPNFWVLHFLVQAVPVGSRLYRVRGLGRKHGFAVWRPAAGTQPAHWSVVFINASSSRTCSVSISPSSFPTGSPIAGGTEGVQQGPQQLRTSNGQHSVTGATSTAAAPGASRGVQQQAAAAAPADNSDEGVALVHFLDIPGLQQSRSRALTAAQLRSGWHTQVLRAQQQGKAGQPEVVVDVAPQHLCRVDWLLPMLV